MWVIDKIQNLISGLRTPKDKVTGNNFVLHLLTRSELEAMYRSEWLARKIIDIIPFDMTREWREWQAKEDDIEKLEQAERTLGVQQKISRALQLARLYGGSVLYIGSSQGEVNEPLMIDRLTAGCIDYIHVFHQWEIVAGPLNSDIASPRFGTPEYYEIVTPEDQSRRAIIHPSRVIRFIGSALPDPVSIKAAWGDSVLQIVYDAVQNAASSQSHVASLLPEMKTDIIRVPGLSEHLSTVDSTERLTSRFAYANQMKSMFNMLLLEGSDGKNGEPQGETWEQKQLNFSAFPDLLRMYLQIAAGAADIPVTRLLGQSPAGLNSTGESDIRNYYDHISARQNVELRPALDSLDEILIRHALGIRPAEVWYKFSPLWQLSETEKAEVDHKRAQTTEVYVTTGLFPLEALAKGVQNQLIEDGVYPGFENAMQEAGGLPDYEGESGSSLPATNGGVAISEQNDG